MSASQLEAFVVNGGDPDRGGWIQLPISREDFLETAAVVGVTDPGRDSIRVTMAEPEMEALAPHLKEPFDLNELNYFAAKLELLEDMEDERYHAFAANLQAGRHCGSVAEMINLLENMNRVDLQPAFSPEQYGRFHIELAQDEYAGEMGALENSENPLKNGFADYISDLERCMDVRAYGKLIANREGGVFTDFGYLTESGPFEEVYRGTRDIPAEFQATPFPNAQPLVKLENTDLTGALTKIHALSGHSGDLEHNLEVLHRRRSAEFLLLLTGDNAVLSEAMHVYRDGTTAHDAFVGAGEAKMFSIYVTDFETDFIGDIREVDASERRADILGNSMDFVAVSAQTADGARLIFTPEEWETVSQAERDSFQTYTRQFDDADYRKMFRHIEERSMRDDEKSKAVPEGKFLDKLAKNLPAKAERAAEKCPKSVLVKIAAARHKPQPRKPDSPKHRTEPGR